MNDIKDRIVALIGHQRTGTHLLGSCIGSHRDVAYLDELTTHWRLSWLVDKIGCPHDFEELLARKFGALEERWLLIDVKFNMIKCVPALEEFLRQCKVIAIIRDNNEAWFYSFLHARYRKERGLGEYGEVDKAIAKPLHDVPTIRFPEWLRTHELAKKAAYYSRFLYLADRILSYEDLTGNVHIDALPKWACWVVCQFLDIKPRLLTTTMTKMSQLEGVKDG